MAGVVMDHMRHSDKALLRVEDLVVEFPARRKQVVHAVSGVSFDVLEGETLGIVGESGCGKSTTGRAIMQLPRPTSGSVSLEGVELTSLKDEELRRTRTRMQLIFQDPISSLNPRRSIKDIVAEGLTIQGVPKDVQAKRIEEVLEAVGLDPAGVGGRRPRELSGGQCQRICIARAVALEPKLLICDEPVSALDVSVQAQILNLLQDMKARYQLTMVFIAHDLAVVKNISDRIMVMYLGKTCEIAAPDDLFARPRHHYTSVLLNSIPQPDPRQRSKGVEIAGELPSPLDPPSGCRFRTRCPAATDLCATKEPELRELAPGHFTACHHPVQTGQDQERKVP
ncbi:ABC transporter ATP-binding protein [Streptomyces blattellae]|uniref:ABC transporter ATP-binding protein n=1 Tax=Streptomyces blattellae TaxID=2569855 RepID=UPI0012B8E955|nr:oligopeptide/dipeptide ABC transporter ATP-binding protein [Streptomyces blattellae]